ncbi:MAG: malto-oligosyltrehalose trehalohydrolase [Erythrobacter sp.]|jgi:maltooligosyltrehalose trehalohydrolase|nr:malto-oligosyltrehalose trehalohydrolase [Erythrobacter sp.]
MMRWGPRLLEDGKAEFVLWAPNAGRVSLVLDGAGATAMEKRDAGWFACTAEAPPGTRYRFRLPDGPGGGLDVPDPASRRQDGGVHGWSVVCEDDYEWRKAGWRGRPWEEAVIWECHAGVLGGYSGVAERLPELAELGITAVELMPVAAFSGSRNWGYDGVLPYAPAEAYGSPDDLKALVDRAHELGLMMMLDVVYNHFGPDGNYLGTYASDFFHGAHTPWGQAVSVDKEPVARFFIDNALMWLEEYRFDGLRFDAVHAIGDDAFLDRMGREIRAATKARHVHLVLENEANDPVPLEGPYDAQWNDDFHNALHVLLTGESDSYYEAFADEPAERVGRSLSEGFSYQGEEVEPGRTRGGPSGHLPRTAFVNFLQNHDQVGNRAMGERLIHLVQKDALKAATALHLLAPAIPMIFMGEETGSRSPFLFFTDFHDDLADAVREGRRREFAGFPAFSDPEARKAIPDPNDAATFAASRPEPGPDAEEWRALYAELLALRAAHLVPNMARCESLGAKAIGKDGVRASWKLANGARWHVCAWFGKRACPAEPPSGRIVFETGMPASGPRFLAALEGS